MTITGNKGEWSEIYTLFKLLGDKSLYPGNENLDKIKGIMYPIIKILRAEINANFEYSINQNIIIIFSNNQELLRISVKEFQDKAIYLLQQIKKNSGTFGIQEIEDFMQTIYCSSLKANSSTKSDITIVIHDPKINQTSTLNFSIKSQLGNPSTLLNAGKTTNFRYEINQVNLSFQEISSINSIAQGNKIRERIKKIEEYGGKFNFINTERKTFFNNLVMIDSCLPQILANIILIFYSTDLTKIVDLVNKIESSNPLNFDQSDNHQFYTYKIKKFLTDIALGMMPAKVWTGQYDATGGYLVVKENGDVLCYHVYNRNEFENYLFNNTKLDTASSSRHNFGTIYKEDSKILINLNLQIRFIK